MGRVVRYPSLCQSASSSEIDREAGSDALAKIPAAWGSGHSPPNEEGREHPPPGNAPPLFASWLPTQLDQQLLCFDRKPTRQCGCRGGGCENRPLIPRRAAYLLRQQRRPGVLVRANERPKLPGD